MFPRLKLATTPTPLHPLELLSKDLGVDLWIKRDDLTGFGLGGNKVREAEFLLADAIQQGANVVLTAGTYQSNHARMVAVVARRVGLDCHLFLSGQASDPPTGNLLLDYLSKAKIHAIATLAERRPSMEAYAERLRIEGRRPYVIPIGGANEIGAYGYVVAIEELEDQLSVLPKKETILVFASSSGATYAGLLVGKLLRGSGVDILGIRTDMDPNPELEICAVANALAERLGVAGRFESKDVHLNSDYVGEGFSVATQDGIAALKLVWELEGILLEPVYTAKGMAGLIDLARKGMWKNERVIFLHTGGIPTVFSFETSDKLADYLTNNRTISSLH